MNLLVDNTIQLVSIIIMMFSEKDGNILYHAISTRDKDGCINLNIVAV